MYEAVRDYALEKRGVDAALSARHAEWFVQWAEGRAADEAEVADFAVELQLRVGLRGAQAAEDERSGEPHADSGGWRAGARKRMARCGIQWRVYGSSLAPFYYSP